MLSSKEYPFYFKSTIILLGLILLSFALIQLKEILAPITFAFIISILLNPLVIRIQKLGINRIVAISISILIAFILIGSLVYFLSSQVLKFSENFPVMKVKFFAIFTQLQQWISLHFGISLNKQVQMIKDGVKSSQAILGQTLGSALGVLALIFLVPVYVFLLLYYKKLILNFLYEVFAEKNSNKVEDVLGETKLAIQSYMVGLILEAIAVAILNTSALLILGVEYAILLGVLGAILNVLPYVGGIIAIALPVLIALISKDGYSIPVWVVISYIIIQFIDNHILIPLLVSSRVKINAFFSIFIVLFGGVLWGITGMFLSIPFLAIIKIVFVRIPELKPWGKLLGDEVPTIHKRQIWKKRFSRGKIPEVKI